MRSTLRLAVIALGVMPFLVPLAACDEKDAAKSASPDTSPSSPFAGGKLRDLLIDAGSPTTAAPSASAPSPVSTWDGSMPPRPVPKASPTVGSGMPQETQVRAIEYMTAMMQPRADDAPADATYAQNLAKQLKPIVMSLDHASAEEKAKLNRVEVIGGGRKIDLLLATGCDSETPRRAVVTRANTPLSTLLGHGVLVVRCNDARMQCLQSTRDPTDVLCTTAPRHK